MENTRRLRSIRPTIPPLLWNYPVDPFATLERKLKELESVR